MTTFGRILGGAAIGVGFLLAAIGVGVAGDERVMTWPQSMLLLATGWLVVEALHTFPKTQGRVAANGVLTRITSQERGRGSCNLGWRLFVKLVSGAVEVYFFRAPISDREIAHLPRQTDVRETVLTPAIADVFSGKLRLLNNIRWLVGLALDPSRPCGTIVEKGKVI
jgi:hypothetical protein